MWKRIVGAAAGTCIAVLIAATATCSSSPEQSACIDRDGDGFGAPASNECTFVQQDCDDGNPYVNPGAIEICGNGVDDDCGGGDAPCADADGDGDGPEDASVEDGNDVSDDDAPETPTDEAADEGADEAADEPGEVDDVPPEAEVDAGPCCDDDLDRYGEGPGCLGFDCDDHAASVTTDCTVPFEDWLTAGETRSFNEGGDPLNVLAVDSGTCAGDVRGFQLTVNSVGGFLCLCSSDSYAGGYAITLLDVFVGTLADGGTVSRAHLRITHY